MTVSAKDFEQFARQLLEGTKEIEWRNSASRIYYAAYHACLQQAHRCPENGHFKMGSHEALINRYELQSSTPARSIAYILLEMKRVRCNADYVLDGKFEKNAAVTQMAYHQKISANLEAFLQQFASGHATDADAQALEASRIEV